LLCGAVEAVGCDGLCRFDPAFVDEASMGVRKWTKSTALGPGWEPIRLNYRSFFLVFPLADAVVDPIEEGGRRGNELVPTVVPDQN
jgi:hypothetical protein